MSKPLGPRSRAAPALSLSISSAEPLDTDMQVDSQPRHPSLNFAGPASQSNLHAAALSPSNTPRFNDPPPVLNVPTPRKKSHGSGVQPRVRIEAGGPPANSGDGEQSTIRPEATYSPRERPRRPVMDSIPGVVPPVFPSSIPREDPMIGLREAVNQIAIGYSATPNHNGATTRSPEGSSKSSPGVNSNGSNGQPSLPSPPKAKEFTDEVFEVLSRLGEGAGGAVHQVRDNRDGFVYARKTITTREVSTRQVVRELNIIATTSHVNIVQCFGAYMSPSSSEVKILMEYCDGGSLEAVGQKLKERNAIIGEKIAGRIAESVLQGLAYLHTRRTIHRDIKPSNILLSREGIVKLCDFGVSGELVDSLVGTFTGTLIYMAPERVSGGEYTVRSDVWSTGISLLELVQNKFPFPADLSTIDLIMTITTGEPPTLKDDPEANISWSEDMKDFIRQTLIRDPRSRPTPREMLEHPWIQNVMRHEDHMAKWIRQVWGWPKPGRRSRKCTGKYEENGDSDGGSLSRPSTGSSTGPADRRDFVNAQPPGGTSGRV